MITSLQGTTAIVGLDTVDDLLGGLRDCEILLDVPQVFSVVRLTYGFGTTYEFSFTEHCEPDDYVTAFRLIPVTALRVGAQVTETHGRDCHETMVTYYREHPASSA